MDCCGTVPTRAPPAWVCGSHEQLIDSLAKSRKEQVTKGNAALQVRCLLFHRLHSLRIIAAMLMLDHR